MGFGPWPYLSASALNTALPGGTRYPQEKGSLRRLLWVVSVGGLHVFSGRRCSGRMPSLPSLLSRSWNIRNKGCSKRPFGDGSKSKKSQRGSQALSPMQSGPGQNWRQQMAEPGGGCRGESVRGCAEEGGPWGAQLAGTISPCQSGSLPGLRAPGAEETQSSCARRVEIRKRDT